MAATQAEKRSTFLREANERLTRFEQRRAAFRAEDVRRYFHTLATGKRAARPKPIKA
jgi:hypothetical protein